MLGLWESFPTFCIKGLLESKKSKIVTGQYTKGLASNPPCPYVDLWSGACTLLVGQEPRSIRLLIFWSDSCGFCEV